jgi:proline utilization trans-activator
MAISQGLHKELLNDYPETNISERRRNIWWTVYNLDMKFSTLLGVPVSVQKENITLRLPTTRESNHRAAALRFDVKLSMLTAHVINS